MRNVSVKRGVGNKSAIFIFSIPFFLENPAVLWDNVEKYCRAGQATNDLMAHGHFMPDNKGYKHIFTRCNNYSFSAAKMVARTRLKFSLYVNCMCCSLCNFLCYRRIKVHIKIRFEQQKNYTKNDICWDVMPRRLLYIYWRLEEKNCLHHQGKESEGCRFLWTVGTL